MTRRGHRSRLDAPRLIAALLVLLCLPIASHGAVLYDSWTSTTSPTGSYVVTVQHNDDTSTWDFVFTVDPWDAEGLGLFIDLGDFDLTDTPVMTGTSWEPYLTDGRITLYDTDDDTKACGSGCNINGLNPPLADPDDEWELIFRLGKRQYDGIQTFSFSVNDSALAGISDSDWGLIAVRGRHVCPSGSTHPDDKDDCDFNGDKAYGTGAVVPDFDEVPVPGTALLMGLGLLLLRGCAAETLSATGVSCPRCCNRCDTSRRVALKYRFLCLAAAQMRFIPCQQSVIMLVAPCIVRHKTPFNYKKRQKKRYKRFLWRKN